MNYYEHHIGDYAAATTHLSFVEDAAYSRLLRIYYRDEKPLPADVKAVQRVAGARSKEEREAVEVVLTEFFALAADGWHSKRCDEEIARFNEKREKAKRSADARWSQSDRNAKGMRTHSDRNANASETHDGRNALQSPDTSNQKEKEQKDSVQPTAARFEDFWAVYPNKKGKQEAEKRWRRDKLDGLADQIIAHVRHMAAHDDAWRRGFEPMGSTYLNQARWTDEARGAPLAASQQPGKQLQGLMALEDMKHGLVPQRDHHGHSKIGLPGAGTPAFGGSAAGHRVGVAGGAGQRLALGSGRGFAEDSRGVLDLSADSYRLAESAEDA